MVSKNNRLKTIAFIKNLSQENSWLFDIGVVKRQLNKDKPRFLHFPVTKGGQQFFFKSCLYGRQDLKDNLSLELSIHRFLGLIDGAVGKIINWGKNDALGWYLREYFSLDQGFVCEEEKIGDLKTKQVRKLGEVLLSLWQVKERAIPKSLCKRLLIQKKNVRTSQKLGKRVEEYLQMLSEAHQIKQLGWQIKTASTVRNYLRECKQTIDSFENGRGIFVHGDLAPNNIFWGKEKIILFDWEWSCFNDNLFLGLGVDMANFFTRVWQRPELGTGLLSQVRRQSLVDKKTFKKIIDLGLMFSVLQKIAPMFQHGYYKSDYDLEHFQVLVNILKKSISGSE
ncbi:phosphotransferase [Patescibacteria group bacterium]